VEGGDFHYYTACFTSTVSSTRGEQAFYQLIEQEQHKLYRMAYVYVKMKMTP